MRSWIFSSLWTTGVLTTTDYRGLSTVDHGDPENASMQIRDHPQLKLRLPPDLHEQIKSDARSNQRSINSEVIFRLLQQQAASEHSRQAPL